MADERRGREDRKLVAIDCHIEGVSGNAPLRLSDLGLGGGYVEGVAQVERDRRIIVTFSLDGHELQCAARVAHVQPARGFGFAFFRDELPGQARLALERFVDGDE